MRYLPSILTFLVFTTVALHSADKTQVLEAYKQLSKTFTYTNSAGKQVRVKSLRYTCRGQDCTLLADGKPLDPSLVLGGNSTPVQETPEKEPEKVTLPGTESGKMKGITEAHNIYRRELKIPDLVWDDSLAAYAQEWATNLQKRKCAMVHRSSNKFGENLAWSGGWKMNPNDVVKMWYDEVAFYNYSSNSCQKGKVCGHYTQVVWKNSKRLGCAMASCKNSEIWVCNYDPPGNYVGQKPY
jgi:pathogenesis-related protein 1